MSKKIISSFTMVVFIVFSLSCYTLKKTEIETVPKEKGGKLKILKVLKSSGELIEFSKKHPGRIYKDTIMGTAIGVTKKIELDKGNVERAEKEKNGKFLIIITKDGVVYKDFIGAVEEEKDKFIFTFESSESVSISLAEVEFVWTKSLNLGLTSLLVIVSVPVAFFVGFVILVTASGGMGN